MQYFTVPRCLAPRCLATVALAATAVVGSTAHAADRFATQVSAGDYHSCLVTSCGEVECFGRNDHGQSAGRTPTLTLSLNPVPEFESVSVGQFHTCALDVHGEADCWGRGNYGQTAEPSGPFVQLDSGFNHNCAIDDDAGIVCWGADDQGQVSDAPTSGRYKQVSSGRSHSCAVSEDGIEVVCWGSDAYGQAQGLTSYDLPSGELFDEVSAGGYHSCVRSQVSRVYCWGYDGYQAVTRGGAAYDVTGTGIYQHPSANYRAVDTGTWGTVSIFRDPGSQILAWGWPFSQGSSYAPPSNVPAQVSTGAGHACMVDTADDAVCWGSNSYGKATVPAVGGTCASFQPFPLPWTPIWP